MTQGTGAAMNIDLIMREMKFMHGGHRNHRESLVDFVKINLFGSPAGLFEKLVQGTDRRGRKPLGLLRMGTVADDVRKRLAAISSPPCWRA